ncbi:MAG: caspase family protein [bacterium]
MMRYLHACVCAFALFVVAGAAFAGPPTQYPELNKTVTAAKTGAADVAVIVAIEDYIFLPKVAGATSNGNDWEKFFMDSLGVKTVHFLSNSQGTKEELERFAKIAAEGSQPGGTVWFVFIGHGAPAKDGKEGLLVGADARQEPNSLFARGIPQQELLNILQSGQQAQTVLIVDACFSGRAGDGSALAPAQPVIPTTIAPKITDTTVVLTAAEASEFAGSLPGANRPAFSYLLLGALQGWAADSSQTVSAKQAQMYVQRALRGIPGRMSQTPSIHGNGDIVLTRGVSVGDPGIKGVDEPDGTSSYDSTAGRAENVGDQRRQHWAWSSTTAARRLGPQRRHRT